MDSFTAEALEGRKFEHLTQEQVDSFMKDGYLRLPGCFSREQAEKWTRDVWVRLGFDPEDPDTWATERTNMPRHNSFMVEDFAPKAYHAMCELAGGEDKVTDGSKKWYDNFIVNLGTKEFEGKQVEPKELPGWHVDGDFFVHFLDSPEQGLLVIPLFTDILPNGGGTFVCPDGIGKVAQWLHEHPDGVLPRMSPVAEPTRYESGLQFYLDLAAGMPDGAFHEMTGDAGDVILLHPLMLHSASRNGRRLPRIITNPPVALHEPFSFDRPSPRDYSLVELKTIQALGGPAKTKGWKITGKRAEVVPERVRRQAKMVEDERRRLAERGGGAAAQAEAERGAAPVSLAA